MNRPMPWPSVRLSGCKRPERDLDWDAVRYHVQEAVGAHAGSSAVIDTVEEKHFPDSA